MRWLLALILTLALSAPCVAAPAHVQDKSASSSPVTLTSAPTTGNIVVCLVSTTAATGGDTCTDSNSVGLTLELSQCSAANAACIIIFDYIVPGTPTAVYTVSATSLLFISVMEVSGALLSTGIYAGNTAASTSTVATIGGVLNTDMQIMATGASANCCTASLSNGSIVPFAAANARSNYALATSTASSTYTNTATTNPTVAAVDYAATARTTTVPDLGQTIGLMRATYIVSLYPPERHMLCVMRYDGGDTCWRT